MIKSLEHLLCKASLEHMGLFGFKKGWLREDMGKVYKVRHGITLELEAI